jgi:hypothetical protein
MWNSPCNDGNFPHGHALSLEMYRRPSTMATDQVKINRRRSRRSGTRCLGFPVCLFALLGVLQNDAAPMSIDESPFLDLLQGSEAAEAGEVIVQAAISYARGLSGDVGITH